MINLLVFLTLYAGTLGDPVARTITLNVGGSLYTTTPATLTRFPDSVLALHYKADRSSYFYDRDGDIFRHVLNYLRNGRLLIPTGFDQLDLLREEAKYFNLYIMHDDIVELQAKQREEHDSLTSSGRADDPRSSPAEDPGHTPADKPGPAAPVQASGGSADDTYECVIVCADEDGKVERWFSAPVDLRFENNGCLLGDCEMITGYSHILDYRDYTARPGNTVPDHFNIAAIVARLLKAGFQLTSSSSGMDEWHREFYFVFVRRIKKI